MQCPRTLGPENRGHRWSVYLVYSIAWHAGKQMRCTFGISDLSASWQPLSYKEVSKPLATVTYPELCGRASKRFLPYSSGAQETLFTSSKLLALHSRNGSSKPLWKGKAWNTIDLCHLRTGSSARKICPSTTELFAPSETAASPLFWLMVFKTGLFSLFVYFSLLCSTWILNSSHQNTIWGIFVFSASWSEQASLNK